MRRQRWVALPASLGLIQACGPALHVASLSDGRDQSAVGQRERRGLAVVARRMAAARRRMPAACSRLGRCCYAVRSIQRSHRGAHRRRRPAYQSGARRAGSSESQQRSQSVSDVFMATPLPSLALREGRRCAATAATAAAAAASAATAAAAATTVAAAAATTGELVVCVPEQQLVPVKQGFKASAPCRQCREQQVSEQQPWTSRASTMMAGSTRRRSTCGTAPPRAARTCRSGTQPQVHAKPCHVCVITCRRTWGPWCSSAVDVWPSPAAVLLRALDLTTSATRTCRRSSWGPRSRLLGPAGGV